MAKVNFTVNGKPQSVDAGEKDMLLYYLRDDLKLNGPKFGCGIVQCGACTVLGDGTPMRACMTPIVSIADKDIVTLDGLATDGTPSPLQQAFIDEQAAQCGYCINGMIMVAKSLLDKNPQPTRAEIKDALNANLCRCGTHTRIIRAVERAAKEGATA